MAGHNSNIRIGRVLLGNNHELKVYLLQLKINIENLRQICRKSLTVHNVHRILISRVKYNSYFKRKGNRNTSLKYNYNMFLSDTIQHKIILIGDTI